MELSYLYQVVAAFNSNKRRTINIEKAMCECDIVHMLARPLDNILNGFFNLSSHENSSKERCQ